MALKVRTKIRSGYIIAFLLLLLSYFLIFFIVRRLVEGTKDVTASYSFIIKLESLRSDIVDAETSVRGYVITKEVAFLMPYYSSVKTIPLLFRELNSLIPQKDQQDKLNTLRIYADKKMALLAEGIRQFQQAGLNITGEMIANRGSGKATMDSIRDVVDRLKLAEEGIMKGEKDSLNSFFISTVIIAVTSLLITVITIIFSLITYSRENRAKEQADEKANSYRLELENRLIELKQVNAELRELKQIEKFAATGRIARTIAHEVRNPLTNITLATEQLQESISQNEEPAFLLSMVRRNADRIDHLVSDLLQSTRFAQLDFTNQDITQLLNDTLELAKDRLELKHITVYRNYSSEPLVVSVDQEKMKLALLNIIVNAAEAMENEEGKLVVRTSRNGQKCLIEIIDNGPGMDDDTLQKIFEPYYTVKKNGAGLGLTNSQNIIFNHKGTIAVQSRPGKGSVFTVTLDLSS